MKLEIDNILYPVVVVRKNNKNAYIRIKDNNTIYVTVPFLFSDKKVLQLLNDNKKSIKNMLKKSEIKSYMNDGIWYLGKKYYYIETSLYEIEFVNDKIFCKNKKILEQYLDKEMRRIYKERLDYWYNRFEEKIPYPKLKFRKMKTRWGVCNKKDNSVTLNTELIKYDIDKLDYVIIHELSHFRHFNHSESFWKLVSKYEPNYKKIRKELR